MRFLLLLLSMLSGSLGAHALIAADGPEVEVRAHLLFLIAAILLVGALILDSLKQVRTLLEQPRVEAGRVASGRSRPGSATERERRVRIRKRRLVW